MKTPRESKADGSVGDQTGTKKTRERWPGGYVREGVYVIERKINGEKFHKSTHATTLRAAMKHLERFEADPAGYKPVAEAGPGALVLTEPLIDEFHEWHLPRVSRAWALDVRRLLIDWANHLQGADLRRLSITVHLEPHLRGATQQHHRVSALKAFTKWARKTDRLKRSEDATQELEVPQVGASEEPKDMEFELVVETWPHLDHYMRDIVQVLAAAGWHLAELQRFAEKGVIRERNHRDSPEVVGVIGVVHKNSLLAGTQKKHFTALVHAEPFEAAKRIRALGKLLDRWRLRDRMVTAAEMVTAERRKKNPAAPEADTVHLGAFRHSVTTWLSEQGLSDGQIAKYVGHASEEMARKHYINKAKTALVLPRSVLRVVS